jgi:hypothetical protein
MSLLAGKLTFDGVLYYVAYDAWNRMVIVRKDNSEYKDESLVAK